MRCEYKFRIPYDLLPELRRRIHPFLSPDTFSVRDEVPGYIVRSIYYDTGALDFYHEKLSGLKTRKKLRLRGYGDFCEDAVVFLEIKRKENNIVCKNHAPLLHRSVAEFFRTGDIERYIMISDTYPCSKDDARQFLFHFYHKQLRPVILVVYHREAYFGKFDRQLRLTLDRDIRSGLYPSPENLFSENGMVRSGMNTAVLEVKFTFRFPEWLLNVLRSFGLQRQPFSKYCICVEDHCTAGGVFSPQKLLLPCRTRTEDRR